MHWAIFHAGMSLMAMYLGCLDFTLSGEHLKVLDEVSRIELGFPHDFLADFGFRPIRTSGPVDLARLELGGLVPVLEGKRARVLRALKDALLPEPVPQPRRP